VRSVESTYARAHLAQILASMSVDAKAMSAHAKAMSAHAKESESLLISSNVCFAFTFVFFIMMIYHFGL